MSDSTDRCASPGGVIRLLAPIVLICLGGCAHKPPATTAHTRPPAPQRMAWMPLDPFDAPSVARAVNERMGQVKPAGTSASVKAAVSMEVAQLAIECIQPTTECYSAVGRSLGADRLMWAELDPMLAPDDRIKVTVLTFDVRAGSEPRRVEETFAGVQAARAGAGELVNRAAD